MDAVLVALAQSAPQVGIGGLLVSVIVLLVRRESSTESRHAAELDRVNADHDDEVTELNRKIKELRADVDELDGRLRRERQLRLDDQEHR